MKTYRAYLILARIARLAGNQRRADCLLDEAMLCRWRMNGNPTWWTRDSIRDWNRAHA